MAYSLSRDFGRLSLGLDAGANAHYYPIVSDQVPDDPWVPKALLAALDASPDGGDRAWMRGRLEAYSDSPYVRVAHGGGTAGFTELEEELEVRLSELSRQ